MILDLKSLVLVLVVACAGVALAEYNPEDDVYLTIDHETTNQLAEETNVAEVGSLLFDTQEGAHATITDKTGEEIDHYYIKVCFGKSCIPIDPLRFRN